MSAAKNDFNWHLLENRLFEQHEDIKQMLLSNSQKRAYKKDNIIFSPGQNAPCCYYINKGTVKISQTTRRGRDQTFFIRQSGAFFGVIDMLNRASRRCYAIAISEAEIYTVAYGEFIALAKSSFEFSEIIMKFLAKQIHMLNDHVRDLTSCDVETRILKMLVRLSYEKIKENADMPRPVEVPVRFTQHELAALIGSSQPTVSSAMHKLQAEGIIKMRQKTIVLLDPMRALKWNFGD